MSDITKRVADLSPEKRAEVLRALKERRESAARRITAQPRDGRAFPLSHEQERMWFVYQWDRQSPLYNVTLTFHIRGALVSEALRGALQYLGRRHEVLRTRFKVVDDQSPVQISVPSLTIDLPYEDLRYLPDAWSEFYGRGRAELSVPFDLERGPLIRLRLYQLGEAEFCLTLAMHHIVADGWSMRILAHELAACYAAEVAGQVPLLPPLEVQYADFAAWQREWLRGERVETLANYWKARLADAPRVLDLPRDHPRPAEQTLHGACLPCVIDSDLSARLKAKSQVEGVTLFMVLLAAFGVLLRRVTGQDDLVVGTPVANRVQADVSNLLGVFVNTLVLRLDLSGNPTFRELVMRVRQVALDGYAHQALPFAQLVELLQPERSLSHTPIFQVSFGFQENPAQALHMPGLQVELLDVLYLRQRKAPPLHNGTTMFDLTLNLFESQEGVGGVLEYSTALFDESTARRIVERYLHLVENVSANWDTRIADIPILPEREMQLVGNIFSQALPLEFGTPLTLVAHFAVQAARTPTAIALASRTEQLTYAELDRRSNQWAHWLRRQGVETETVVGIALGRTAEAYIALLGVLKAGGAYLPLDPQYPADRLAYMVKDAQAKIILTHAEHRALFESMGVLVASEGEAACSECPDDPLALEIHPEQLAYVIYTSGSTGWPKGVWLAQAGAVHLAYAQIGVFLICESSRVLQFASLNFDASVSEVFTALLAGATLCFAPQADLMPGPELLETLRVLGITVVTLPPSVLNALEVMPLPALETLVAAGEACPLEVVQTWGRGRRFLNAYGPTEVTVCASWGQLSIHGERVTIGRPLPGKNCYILDGNGHLAPIGVPGELHVGGVGLARGYVGRPDFTAGAFVPDAYSGLPGARLYRTGDIVRWLPDGKIEFLGRRDHQVKLRGFRIELQEIEDALSQHPAVRQAAADLQVDGRGEKQLVAYLVPEGEGSLPDVRAWQRLLKQRLPAYMIPGVFVTLAALPLTTTGKLDRRALANLNARRLAPTHTYVPPRNALEEKLAGLWAHVLQVKQVGIRDNFFELGGDSIRSLRMASAATQMGLTLAPRVVFEHQTIAELAAVVRDATTPQADQRPVTGEIVPTPIMHWFGALTLKRRAHWNQAVLLLTEPLEPAALERAWQAVQIQHDILRLRVQITARGPRYVCTAPDTLAEVEWVRIEAGQADARRAAIESRLAEAQAGLNFAQGVLVRAVYFDCGPHEPGRLAVLAHHLAIDAVSWSLVLPDLFAAYQQARQGGVPHLPAKTTSFQAWALALQAYAQSAAVAKQAAYWLAALRVPAGVLPLDAGGAAHSNSEEEAAVIKVHLSVEATTSLLREALVAYSSRAEELILTALALCLTRWVGGQALLLDVETHGREASLPDCDISRTVGWFTELFPVALPAVVDTALGPAIKLVKEAYRESVAHGLSYGLLRYLSSDADLRRQFAELPCAQVSFNYLATLASEAGPLADESLGPLHDPQGQRPYALELEAEVRRGQLELRWRYGTRLHRAETIQRLADESVRLLQALITHCLTPEAGGYTPSDFKIAGLSQQDLDKLMARLPGWDDDDEEEDEEAASERVYSL